MKKLLSFLLLLLLAACPARALEEANTALIVEDVPVYLPEVYIYMFSAEQEYAEIVEYYKTYLGIDYWSLEYPNGMTISQMVKSDVFKEILMMNVFYSMALDRGLSLSASEKEACRRHARDACAMLPSCYAERIPQSALESVLEKQRLADRMYSMLLGETDVNEITVADGIDRSLYATYDVEYLFCPLIDIDENGATETLAAEKEALVSEKLSEARSLEALSEAQARYGEYNIHYATASFYTSDAAIDPVLLDTVKALQPGETSGVIKTDHGLFLIRLIDNTGETAYRAAVATAVYAAREEAFSKEYNLLFMNAEYEINVSFWDTVMPGMSDFPD